MLQLSGMHVTTITRPMQLVPPNDTNFCRLLSPLQLESCLNGLEERLRQYHSACHRLALLPASAKRAAGVAYDMAVNRAAASQAELISGDIKVGSRLLF